MMIEAKKFGMSDRQIGRMVNVSENDARVARINKGIMPWVKQVFYHCKCFEDFLFISSRFPVVMKQIFDHDGS